MKSRLAVAPTEFDARHVYGAFTVLDTFRTYRFRKYVWVWLVGWVGGWEGGGLVLANVSRVQCVLLVP